jgi:hypothetical protein
MHTCDSLTCCILCVPSCLAYTPPLIGPEYQVTVGPFVAPATRDPALCFASRHRTSDDNSDDDDGTSKADDPVKSITINAYFAQTAEWNPHLKGFHTDRRKQEALDKYLNNVETLFYKDARHMTQDVALHFLHQCDYDIPQANRLLKPWQPPGQTPGRSTQSQPNSFDARCHFLRCSYSFPACLALSVHVCA